LKGTCTDVQGTAGARGWWPNLTASGTEITPGWSGAIGDFAVSWAGSEAIAAGITLGFGSAGGVSTVKHVTIKSICIVTHGDTTLDGDPECV